jgi:hypothetical protein
VLADTTVAFELLDVQESALKELTNETGEAVMSD